MANNYLQFSTIVSGLTKEEEAWVESEFKRIEHPSDEEADSIIEKYNLGLDEDSLDFEWALDDGSLWIGATESGNPDHVAEFMRDFLRANRPNEYLVMGWSFSCDKLRADEFGGGAMFVTAQTIDYFDTVDWMEEKRKSFAER